MKLTDAEFDQIFREKLNEIGVFPNRKRNWAIVSNRLDKLENSYSINLKFEIMTHYYQLTGLTCDGCVATVKKLLSKITGVQSIEINEGRNEATITMTQHISTDTLKEALRSHPKYTIEDKSETKVTPSVLTAFEGETDTRSWLETYKPLLLVFGYITVITCFAASDWMTWMRYFMAGFFLVFSFFKMLDLRGFADSYRMYDIVAKAIPIYGFIYPFIELWLGLSFLIDFNPLITNITTIIVMGISTIGVLQSILNKRKIQCACLGAVFNLPMSTVTIIEDLLMVFMAIAMLYLMF